MVKLLAEIINDFFEPLTYKSMIFIILIFIGLFLLSGCLNKRESISYNKKNVWKLRKSFKIFMIENNI